MKAAHRQKKGAQEIRVWKNKSSLCVSPTRWWRTITLRKKLLSLRRLGKFLQKKGESTKVSVVNMFHNCLPPQVCVGRLGNQRPSFQPKFPFYWQHLYAKHTFCFRILILSRKTPGFPGAVVGKPYKRRLLIYFSHSPRCSSLIRITCRPPTADWACDIWLSRWQMRRWEQRRQEPRKAVKIHT